MGLSSPDRSAETTIGISPTSVDIVRAPTTRTRRWFLGGVTALGTVAAVTATPIGRTAIAFADDEGETNIGSPGEPPVIGFPKTGVGDAGAANPAETAVDAPAKRFEARVGNLVTDNIEMDNLFAEYGLAIDPADFKMMSDVAKEKGAKLKIVTHADYQSFLQETLKDRTTQDLNLQTENFIDLVTGPADGGLLTV